MTTIKKTKTNSAKLLHKSLHKILYYPVRVSQLTGSFIFSLEPNAKISFSWLSLPTILVFCKFTIGSIFYIIFWYYKEEYVVTFGNWSDVDLFIYTSMAAVGFCSDIFCSLKAMIYRKRIIQFHNELIQFTTQVHLESAAKDTRLLGKYLKTFKKSRNSISIFVAISVIFACYSFLSALPVAMIIGIKIVRSRTFIQLTIPVVLFFAVFVHIVRNSQYYTIASVFTFISSTLEAINDQIKFEVMSQRKDTVELTKILEHYKRLNGIIKDVNLSFEWVLVTGILTLLFNTLCSLFEIFAWFPAVGLQTTIILVFPMLPPVIAPLYCICKAAADIRKKAICCVAALRDIGSLEWVVLNKNLTRRIQMYHIAGLIEPPSISPGHFFTIHRNTIPSVVAVMITYLLVLIQFQMKDENITLRGTLWQKAWDLISTWI